MAKPLSSLTNVRFLLWNIRINGWIHTLNGLKRVVLIHYHCNSDVSTFKWQSRMLKIQRTTKSKWNAKSCILITRSIFRSLLVCVCVLDNWINIQHFKRTWVSAQHNRLNFRCAVSPHFSLSRPVCDRHEWHLLWYSLLSLSTTFKSITLKCVWICQRVSRLLSLKL